MATATNSKTRRAPKTRALIPAVQIPRERLESAQVTRIAAITIDHPDDVGMDAYIDAYENLEQVIEETKEIDGLQQELLKRVAATELEEPDDGPDGHSAYIHAMAALEEFVQEAREIICEEERDGDD